MNRMILGAVAAVVLIGIGLFWLQGRAEVEQGAPPPTPAALAGAEERPDPTALPTANVAGMEGPAPPEATELTRDQARFFRYDRDRDGRITRNEMLSTRTSAFRKLDVDGNNLLTFEEWAVTTSNRFAEMDGDGDGVMTLEELSAYYRRQEEK